DVELDEKSSAILQDLKSVFNWKSILNWKLFWKEQLFLYLNPNQTALLLVSLDENFRKLFMDTVSKKQKRIIQDELFFLNQGANSEELNPHSKNKGLFNFDSAEKELRRVIESLTARMEKENEL
ncbi:MAG: hypothetical protein K8R21_04025, partial [Leptospira sp.]|nr:hypothetical protein [Leptospira sp.]